MRNKIGKAKIAYLTMVLVIICAILMLANTTIFNVYAENIEENIAYLTQEKYEMTNSQESNGIKITDYPTNHYGKNATLEWGDW